MTDDSQQNDDSNKGSGEKPSEFEFDASDIPGLNLAPEASESTPGQDLPGYDFNLNPEPAETAAPDALDASAAPAELPESAELAAPAELPARTEPSPLPSDPASETTTAPAVASPQSDTIQKVKEFAENMPMEKVQVPAAFPFSLLIEGKLAPEEKEKLLDVLSRESVGIREVDLEPQFEGHRILIPRISEYAGIVLVQALRGTRAKMRLGPSETIFSAQDAEISGDPLQPGMRLPEAEAGITPATDYNHPAERIALTSDSSLPQLPGFDVIDTVLASAVLRSNTVEAEHSPEYSEILENLKRELKYKAHRKGATGIVRFKTELQQLSLGNQYRLTLSGTAIRPQSDDQAPLSQGFSPEATH